MQFNGHRVWPDADNGFFSMSTGTEVPMNLLLSFDGPQASITLFDQEDFSADDNLGSLTIHEGEGDGGT